MTALAEKIGKSKEAAQRWSVLFQRALPECADVEEAVIVADLAFAELPESVELSNEVPLDSGIVVHHRLPQVDCKDSLNAYFAYDIENRQAQGILNRAIAAAKKMNKSARVDLEKALRTGDRTEMGRALLDFVQKYKNRLADLLTTTQLASLLAGAREVAKSIPTVPAFPGAAPPPATMEPAKAVELLERLRAMPVSEREQAIYEMPADQQRFARHGLLAAQQGGAQPPGPFIPVTTGDTDRIHFPIIDEAARNLASKNVMSKMDFDSLENAARAKAFTVANVESMATMEKIRDALADTVEQGADLQTFRERVLKDVDEGTFMSDWHLEVVFRTNVQTAFSDGQMAVLQHPFVKSGFPYAAYEAIHDDRVRHDHLALESLGIDGTNIYRIDDPVFVMFRPPFAWACRCSWIPMTVRMAASKGIAEAQQWLDTGIEPTPPAFVPMPSFRPPPGFVRSVSGAPLSIQLSLQPMSIRFSTEEKGRWITIGGKKGEDGKRHGGSPVYIENGRITKGHPSLTGKKLGSLKDEGDSGSHRQQVNKSKDYARAIWAKKARKEGIDKQSLQSLAEDVKQHHDAHAKDVAKLLRDARKNGIANVHHQTLKKAFDGGDYAKIPGFDQLARELAGEYPHILGAHGYDASVKADSSNDTEASEKLFELLKQGNPEMMGEDDAYSQAFDILMSFKGASEATREPGEDDGPKRKRRGILSDEPIPFSLTGVFAMLSQVHSPVGGISIGGTFYQGGEFIPEAAMKAATKEEKAPLLDEKKHLARTYKADYPGADKDAPEKLVLHVPGEQYPKIQGNDADFVKHYHAYVSSHLNQIRDDIEEAIGNEDQDAADKNAERITSLVGHFYESVYAHFEHQHGKDLEYKGSSDFDDRINAAAQATIDAVNEGDIDALYAEMDDLQSEMDDAASDFAESVDAEREAFDEAYEATENAAKEEIESAHFEDLQSDVDDHLDEDSTQEQIDQVWTSTIRDYNKMIDGPYRISLDDDGELEVVHEDDLPKEYKPSDAALSLTDDERYAEYRKLLGATS